MSTPKISLVVPVYNEAGYLPTLIKALKDQTFKDFEVIVVDTPKTTDNTAAICQKAGFIHILQKNPGISAARAEGFAKAKAPIIASTDADSAPVPTWLSQISEKLADPQVAGVYGPTKFYEDRKLSTRLSNLFGVLFVNLNRYAGNDMFFGMNFAVSQKAYQQIGGFNIKLPTAEDMDLGYRLKKVGQIVYVKDMLVYTSDRRLKGQGWLRFITHHTINFIGLKLFGRARSSFEPYR